MILSLRVMGEPDWLSEIHNGWTWLAQWDSNYGGISVERSLLCLWGAPSPFTIIDTAFWVFLKVVFTVIQCKLFECLVDESLEALDLFLRCQPGEWGREGEEEEEKEESIWWHISEVLECCAMMIGTLLWLWFCPHTYTHAHTLPSSPVQILFSTLELLFCISQPLPGQHPAVSPALPSLQQQ